MLNFWHEKKFVVNIKAIKIFFSRYIVMALKEADANLRKYIVNHNISEIYEVSLSWQILLSTFLYKNVYTLLLYLSKS